MFDVQIRQLCRMNSKSTWFWALVAAALFAFIYFYERHAQPPETGPDKVLPGLRVSEISAVAVRIGNQLKILAVRTNQSWQLTQPVDYPAQNASVENLLAALEKLTIVTPITAAELRKRPKADEEFGFSSPQAALILYRGEQPTQILLGARTAPGDQVFLRVVGVEDIFVVDATLFTVIPRTVDDWCDRAFADWTGLKFDRITVTSGAKVCELQRDGTNQPWRITRLTPARANNAQVEDLLQKLLIVRVNQFVPEDSKTDLESYGLQPPDFELTLSAGTNSVLDLQFGKSPTNDSAQIFARRENRNAIVTVGKEQFEAWRSPLETFRDHHLVAVTRALDAIEVHGDDNFTLQHQTNGSWLVQPQNFLADSNSMAGFLASLGNLQVTLVSDAVTEPDRALKYGLAPPSRRFTLKTATGPGDATNTTIVQLDFGATNEDRIYARRTDEESVYAVSLEEFKRLPSASWLMRNRRIWNFNVNDVAGVTIQQFGRTRRIIRNGPHNWSLAPGSQGVINDLALEELTPRFGALTAAVWTDHGSQNRARYGFTDLGHQVTFELKDGSQRTVEFGGEAPSQFPYAAVTLDGETWIFEFPWDLYQHVLTHFSAPLIIP